MERESNKLYKLHNKRNSSKMDEATVSSNVRESSNARISKVYLQANYQEDRHLLKMIKLVKVNNAAQIARLPPSWREKFNSFSVDDRDLLYFDERLVIPKNMRENMLNAIHFGHAGRDAMLREAADVWWPRINREIIEKANNCQECSKAGKNIKCLKTQNEYGKLPIAEIPNDEISINFAGPFQNAKKNKKYLLVSVDHNSGWPEALFLPNPTAD